MILSAVIGLIFREWLSPYEKEYNIKEKTIKYLLVAVIIGYLTYFSTFMSTQIVRYFVFLIILVGLILVNCPIGIIYLIRKKEKERKNKLVLLNSVVFLIVFFSIIVIQIFMYQYSGYYNQLFYPLSYPLMLFQTSNFTNTGNLEITHLFQVFLLNISFQVFQRTFPSATPGTQYSKTLQYRICIQLFFFVIFFVLNYLTTLGIMKKFTRKREQKEPPVKLKDLAFISTLGMVIAYFSLFGPQIVPLDLLYRLESGTLYRYYQEIINFNLLAGFIVAILIGWKFYEYKVAGKSYEYQTRRLLQLTGILLITPVIMLGAELILPKEEFTSYFIIEYFFQLITTIVMIVLTWLLYIQRREEEKEKITNI